MPQPVRLHDNPETHEEVVREREALEEMIRTDGWRYFLAHVSREFEGFGYRARMKIALGSTDPIAARLADRTADEVIRLVQWPTNQVNELKGVVEED